MENHQNQCICEEQIFAACSLTFFTVLKHRSWRNSGRDYWMRVEYTVYMDVSENSGTPKSSVLIGFSIRNHPFWGTPIFTNIHIYVLLIVHHHLWFNIASFRTLTNICRWVWIYISTLSVSFFWVCKQMMHFSRKCPPIKNIPLRSIYAWTLHLAKHLWKKTKTQQLYRITIAQSWPTLINKKQ